MITDRLGRELMTVKEFQEITNWSAEYIRAACRGTIDTKGRQAMLPPGYEAVKMGHQWFIFDKFREAKIE